MEDLLRQTVRAVLSESRHITLQAQNRNDLEMAILWIKGNKKLRSVGDIQSIDGDSYVVRLYVKGKLEDAVSLVKDRFGYFVKVIR